MEVVKYDIETAVITALEAKYADIVVTDGKSKAVAMEGLAEYRGLRLKIDAKHKELKADALKFGRAVDDEKNRLKDLLAPGEQHIKDARQVYDDKIAAKKAEKDRIEQERIDKIDNKIRDFEFAVANTVSMSADEVAELCDKIVAIQITEEVYQEFMAKAKDAKLATLSALDDIYNDKVTQETEAAERKAEIAKIEKLRAEQAEAEAKRHEELREIETKKQAAQKIIDDERDKLEAEKRAEQEKRDRAEFERKTKEDFKIQAERNAKEKAERIEREKVEAEKEAKRAAAVLPDKEKLIAFADRLVVLITLELPLVKSKAAKEVIADVNSQLDATQTWIRQEVEAL